MHELYRHFDSDDRLLYVGVSLFSLKRLADHKKCSGWFDRIVKVTIERFGTRKECLYAERAAIRGERPQFNIQANPWSDPKRRKPPTIELVDILIRARGRWDNSP